jgi:sugar phosphate isomerase/epimerase
VGELCKTGGLKLAYHNHDFEFTKFGSTNGYEILLNETDKTLVDFEMDLYWGFVRGHDPVVIQRASRTFQNVACQRYG